MAVTNINSVDDKQAPLSGVELPDSGSGPPAPGNPGVPAASLAGIPTLFPVYPFI